MSTVAVKKVKLGDNADTSKNFLIEVPAVADGTLTIKRENGSNVASFDANNTLVLHESQDDLEGGEIQFKNKSGAAQGYIDVDSTGALRVLTATQSPVIVGVNGTNGFEVNSSGAEVKSGNFVVGNGKVLAKSGASSPANTNNCGYAFTTDHDSGMFNPSDGTLEFACNGTTVMYVDPAKVFVTANYGGSWDLCPLIVETRTTSANNASAGIAFHTPGISSAVIFKFYGPSAAFECRNSTDNGFINIAAANFVVSSDYRLKENVVPLGESLPKLKLIKPSSYTWKDTGKSEDGFIAHELQEVVPQAVFGEKDRVLEDGTPVYQGVDASRIMPLVVKSLQELASKVEALEAELAAFKGQ